jgi:hypothetical protein
VVQLKSCPAGGIRADGSQRPSVHSAVRGRVHG